MNLLKRDIKDFKPIRGFEHDFGRLILSGENETHINAKCLVRSSVFITPV